MAYEILNLDGTVIPVSSGYPFGDIKNAPSGTRVNRKMLADMMQFFQLMMDESSVNPNNAPDNSTNGYQYMQGVTSVIGQYAAQIVINLLGSAYASNLVYVLSGCATRSADGYILYNGSIYAVVGNSGPACAFPSVDVLSLRSPLTYNKGVQEFEIVCGASGTGVADFSDFIYFSEWVETGATSANFGSGSGGTFTVDNADIEYARYQLRGKTVFLQVRLRNISVTSAPAYLSMTLPFIAANAFANTGSYQSGAFYLEPSGNNVLCYVNLLNGSPCTIRVYNPTGWTVGTNDSGIDINIVFEVI